VGVQGLDAISCVGQIVNTVPSFRGYGAIGQIVADLKPLAEFMKAYTPSVRTIRLHPDDYRMVVRWPKAAELHGFSFAGESVMYMGFTIRYTDGKP